MNILYLDCGMGAAGDMLSAALVELLPDRELFIQKLNSIGIPDISYQIVTSEKCGIKGTHMDVKYKGESEEDKLSSHSHNNHGHLEEHDHRGLHGIEHIVNDHMEIPDHIRQQIFDIYKLIAEAESNVHGVKVEEIHFHELGMMDAIADITAVCMLMDRISPDEIIVSPVHTGSGKVRCAHGIVPVPAPATAELLKSIPVYGGEIEGELCTPTGAALIRYFATRFGNMPLMKVNKIGYGMGKKDFAVANCVRAILGESVEPENTHVRKGMENEPSGLNVHKESIQTITELSCNIDDMTAEDMGYCTGLLLGAGALDVYTVSANMKKSRPGWILYVLCNNDDSDMFVRLIFKHTTTLGVRRKLYERFVLTRREETLNTRYGMVRRKISEGYGIQRQKPEYDDLAKIAAKENVSIEEVRQMVKNDLDS